MKRYKSLFREAQDEIFNGDGKGYIVSMTYDKTTPESAEQGDFSESDFEFENSFFKTLEDMVDDSDIKRKSWANWSSSEISAPSDWLSTESEVEDYGIGEEISYSLHIKRKDKKKLTEPEIRYIEKELRVSHPARKIRSN